MRETTGLRLTEALTMAWVTPFTTKSDFARAYASEIAMAASDGHLTTRIATGLYGHRWHITPTGLAHLYNLNGMGDDS